MKVSLFVNVIMLIPSITKRKKKVEKGLPVLENNNKNVVLHFPPLNL